MDDLHSAGAITGIACTIRKNARADRRDDSAGDRFILTKMIVVLIALGVSGLANAYLGFRLYRMKKASGEILKHERELEDLYLVKADLARMGGAIVELRRVDPSGVFFRRPA